MADNNNQNAPSVAQNQTPLELTELLKSVNKNLIELIQVMKAVNLEDKNASLNQTSMSDRNGDRIKFNEPQNTNEPKKERMQVIKGVES